MQITKYPDGSSYAKMDADKISFTYRLNSYESLWHLNQIVDAYNSIGIKPYITIPCLIDAQADRRFNVGESSGLKLVCNFLNGMNAIFTIFHPHNPEVVEALIKDVNIIDNFSFVDKVLADLATHKRSGGRYFTETSLNVIDLKESLVLLSSDAGGFKPLMKLCDKLDWRGEVSSASKARKWEDEKTVLTQTLPTNDYQGKDILIVDDICVYGGTFKGLTKLLRERNCGKIYLAVSHMTVQELGVDAVTNYFDMVYTTNSKYNVYYETNKTVPTKLKVLNLW